MASGILAQPYAALRRSASWRPSAETVLLWASALIVGYLVLSPAFFLVLSSFRRYVLQGSVSSTFTLDNYAETYLSPDLLPALGNTFVYALGGTILAVFIGASLAWVVERTNAPFRSAFTLGAATAYFIPGVLMAVAWNTLANDKIGSLNRLIQAVTGSEGLGPLDVNSMGGMIWVFGTHLYPIVFLIMAAAFRTMDPSLEEAAATSGAGVVATFRRITLGVSRPAIVSALLIMFVRGIESFDVPLMLGVPGGIDVLTTDIYSNMALHNPPEPGIAASLAVLLMLVSVAGVYYYRSATAAALSFSTISGKGYRPHRLDLGRGRRIAASACALFFLVTLVLPILSTAWISLFPFIRTPSIEALQRASFGQYSYIAGYGAMGDAFRNSLVNATVVATAVVLLTVVVAWIALRSRAPGRGMLDALAFAPIGIPGTVMGLAILLVYLSVPIPLYGTVLLVTVAHVTLFLPYGMRLASDALLRIHPQLEEAAHMSGASWWGTFRVIVLPLLLPGLVAAWITVFVASFRELSSAMFLATPNSRMVSVTMYLTWQDGSVTAAAALGMIILVVVLSLSVLAWAVGRLVRVNARSEA